MIDRYKKLAECHAIDKVLTKEEVVEQAIKDYKTLYYKLHTSLNFLHEQGALEPEAGVPHSIECEGNKQVVIQRIRSVSHCLSILTFVKLNLLY